MEAYNLVSFIIPHKGRFEMLKETLHSIALQDYPRDKIEVIIVSQTPDIEKTQLLENNELPVQTFIRPSNDTISALRNFGVKNATGEYLALLDADISISRNWIVCMLSLLESEKDRVIVSAMQTCSPSSPPLEHIRTCLSNVQLDTNVGFLPGRNLFLTRHAFDKVGGFPEHLITCEDYYFTDKAAQLGRLYYTSDASYIHLGEDKVFSEMFKKEIWRGQSNLQSIQGRRIPLREVPSFVLPLAISVSLLIAVVALLFSALPLALLFFLLGVIPLLAYCFRLHRISKDVVNFGSVVMFYATYFPARAVGTLAGLFKSISTNHN